MSVSTCRVCYQSKNVAECCGRPTDLDESFESLAKEVPENLLEFAENMTRLLAVASRTPEESPFTKMDRLAESIEYLGWDVFRFEKSGEMERAKNLRTVIAQEESELKALNIGRKFS